MCIRDRYSTNGFADETQTVLIASNVPAGNLSYTWTVPDAIGTNVKVRITDSNDPTVFDVSDGAFKIKASFTVTQPNGGETWIVGETHDITWSTLGTVGSVKLEYSTDTGNTWTLIEDNVSNTGTYSWTVPDDISSQCLSLIHI